MTMTMNLFSLTDMRTVLRRYYSLYILHTCMRQSEKQGKTKKNKRKSYLTMS